MLVDAAVVVVNPALYKRLRSSTRRDLNLIARTAFMGSGALAQFRAVEAARRARAVKTSGAKRH